MIKYVFYILKTLIKNISITYCINVVELISSKFLLTNMIKGNMFMSNVILKIRLEQLQAWSKQVYDNLGVKGEARFKRRFIQNNIGSAQWIEFDVSNYDLQLAETIPPASVINLGLADWINKVVERTDSKCQFKLVGTAVRIGVTDAESFFDLLNWFESIGNRNGGYYNKLSLEFNHWRWSDYCPLYKKLKNLKENFEVCKSTWMGQKKSAFMQPMPEECRLLCMESWWGCDPEDGNVSDFFSKFKKAIEVDDYTFSILELAIDDSFQELSWIHYKDFMTVGKNEIIVKDGVIDKDWYEKKMKDRRSWANEAKGDWDHFWGLHLSPIHDALYMMGVINRDEDGDSVGDDSYEVISKFVIPGKPSFKISWEVVVEFDEEGTKTDIKNMRFEMI